MALTRWIHGAQFFRPDITQSGSASCPTSSSPRNHPTAISTPTAIRNGNGFFA